jgi:hypothetical protein
MAYFENSKEHPHIMGFSDDSRKKAERVAALMNLDKWGWSYILGLEIASEYAEQHVKGNTNYIFCTKEFDELVSNNQKFFEALCEEGVVEWLTPLVLAKGKTT